MKVLYILYAVNITAALKIKFHLLIFLILIITCPVYGQTGTIKGHVTDRQTKEDLMGVLLILDSTTTGAVSDINGNFIIPNVSIGTHFIKSTYISYDPEIIENIIVSQGDILHIDIELNSKSVMTGEVTIAAKRNCELESILLIDQKNSLTVTKSIGAAELSRKGIGDAESAVTSVAGISKQEGVKNVFVRGLGDRYNATLLNGLPIPSEDPEYKNISLSFFETDIIKNIGVEKVFSTAYGSDVGGAVININSKELVGDGTLGASGSLGINSLVTDHAFLRSGGINYFGFTNYRKPENNQFDFSNGLDPKQVSMPVNKSYRIMGGEKMMLGNNPVSFYAVASLSSDYFYTEETVKNITTDGTVYQDQEGKKYSGSKNQLVLANVNYEIKETHSIAYNFLMLHSNQYYVGEYFGKHTEKFQDGIDEIGFLRRQQINDNLLLTHQLLSKWKISNRWGFSTAASYNRITGDEPDRRENYLSQRENGTFGLTGSNRQKRFFSQLIENDYNAKLAFDYLLNTPYKDNSSKISFGYRTQVSHLFFEAEEYNFSAVSGVLSLDNLSLDDFYNTSNFNANKFSIRQGYPSSYTVARNSHSAFVSGSYQITESLSGVAGFQFDWVTINVMYDVPGKNGVNQIISPFYLPNFHLKYDITPSQILRLGIGKTYTLPQSKEISPYQYVNIGFASEGNPNLRYSDNYNLDIKWDYYINSGEIVSINPFYKKIVNPIGRVYKGNSAGLLTYENISEEADVMGTEAELRKSVFKRRSNGQSVENNLSLGFNFSYICSSAKLNLTNTPERKTALEGASPFIVNGDVTYHFSKKNLDLTATVIISCFSDRIFTIGTMGYNDIIEKAVPTLDFAFNGRLNKTFGWKLKAGNILDPSFRLTREVQSTGEIITLNRYRKGMNISLGLSIDL